MRTYNITLTGKTPLLMHSDNIDWADFLDAWLREPENKANSKAGDDRTPPWRWLGSVYHDGLVVALPQANIMRAIMEGGAGVPTGKGKQTFKSWTQSGMMSVEPAWPIEVNGSTISWSDIEAMKDLPTFMAHKQRAPELQFHLFVKRAKVGMSKHVRVRPQFDAGWQAHGTLAVWDDKIDERALERILEHAGRYKGLGDWRPGGKTPGPYGTFEATIQ